MIDQDWYVHIPHWIAVLEEIDWCDKAILSIVSAFQQRSKSFFMSNKSLAERVKITPRNLIKRIEKLERLKLVVRTQTSGARYLTVTAPSSPVESDMGGCRKRHGGGVANDMGGVSQTTPKSKYKIKDKTKTNKHIDHIKESKASEYSDSFESFWLCYPKKVAKSTASKAFAALAKERGESEGEFSDFLKQHISSRCAGEWREKERRYIPNPASFIRQKRWEDDVSVDFDAKEKPKAYTSRFRTHLYGDERASSEIFAASGGNVYEYE